MIKMITAVDEAAGIGKDNKIPWSCSEDLKHFKEKTLGNIVVMGYKTFESLDFKLLSSRHNVVMTSKYFISDKANLYYRDTIRSILKVSDEYFKDVWIIGGESIYKLFLPHIQELHITRIKGNYDCDKFFPFDELEKYKSKIKVFEYEF